jgi:hypothetical protein
MAIELTKNNGLPIGGGLWIPVLHPELRLVPPYTSWTFPGAITRMPEVAAPALGNKENLVSIDADVPANANGVLYALGGFSGGLTLYVKDGVLSYEYNLFEIMRTNIKAKDKLPIGKVKIEVMTTYVERRPAGPLNVVLKANGNEVASGVVPVSAPLIFTANDCLDFGIDLGSPVGLEYYDQAPFKFNGKIEGAQVQYLSVRAAVAGRKIANAWSDPVSGLTSQILSEIDAKKETKLGAAMVSCRDFAGQVGSRRGSARRKRPPVRRPPERTPDRFRYRPSTA